LKIFGNTLNWYFAFGGGRVIVAMVVDVCKYVRTPAIKRRKLLQSGQSQVKDDEKDQECLRRMAKLLPEIVVVVTE